MNTKKICVLIIAVMGILSGNAQWQGTNPVYFNAGNVGISTTNPFNKLQIGTNPQGYNGNDLVVSNSNGSLAIHNDVSHTFLYSNRDIAIRPGNGQMAVYARSDGNVGIGTANPNSRLDVNGNINLAGVAGRRIFMGGAGGSTFGIGYDVNNPNYGIFYTEGTPDDFVSISPNGNATNGVMNVLGSGNVGIGTNTPFAKLHLIHASNTAYQNAFNITSNNTQDHWPLVISTNNKSNWSGFVGSVDDISLYLRKDDGTLTSVINSDGISFINGGNVGIGTTSPDAKLAVKGTVHANEVKVDLNVPGPDYVFEKNYDLLSLEEIKTYIEQNKHLPEVPSAKEMEANGINLSEMNMMLLKKIEELTLHLVNQNDTMEYLKSEIKNQNKEIELLKKQIK